MRPTPYPELNNVLNELVSGIRQILGSYFIGAYLQGSFALGDFDDYSDVDFAVAIEGELTSEHVRSLQVLHDFIFQLDRTGLSTLRDPTFPGVS